LQLVGVHGLAKRLEDVARRADDRGPLIIEKLEDDRYDGVGMPNNLGLAMFC